MAEAGEATDQGGPGARRRATWKPGRGRTRVVSGSVGPGGGRRPGEPVRVPRHPKLFSSGNPASADLPRPQAGRSRLGAHGHLSGSPGSIEGRVAVRFPGEGLTRWVVGDAGRVLVSPGRERIRNTFLSCTAPAISPSEPQDTAACPEACGLRPRG